MWNGSQGMRTKEAASKTSTEESEDGSVNFNDN